MPRNVADPLEENRDSRQRLQDGRISTQLPKLSSRAGAQAKQQQEYSSLERIGPTSIAAAARKEYASIHNNSKAALAKKYASQDK